MRNQPRFSCKSICTDQQGSSARLWSHHCSNGNGRYGKICRASQGWQKGQKERKKGSGGSRPGTSTSVVSSVDGAEDDKDALRPLDRFLKPLRAKLELKSSIYLEPDTAVEKATILLEQAKDAKDSHLRASLLLRCVAMLKEDEEEKEQLKLSPQNSNHDERPGTGLSSSTNESGLRSKEELREVSNGITLWADIMRMAWSLKLVDLVHETSMRVISGSWDVKEFKEIVILQVEACYTKAQCYVEQVSSAADDLYEGSSGINGLSPKALGLLSGNDIPLQPRF